MEIHLVYSDGTSEACVCLASAIKAAQDHIASTGEICRVDYGDGYIVKSWKAHVRGDSAKLYGVRFYDFTINAPCYVVCYHSSYARQLWRSLELFPEAYQFMGIEVH